MDIISWKLSNSLCLIEVLAFLSKDQLIQMNLVNRKFYRVLIPRSYPLDYSRLWLNTSAYLMFPGDKLYELKAMRAPRTNT